MEETQVEAQPEEQQIQLTPADEKRIRRFIEKARAQGQPLTASYNGAMASDTDGRVYIREVRQTKDGKAAAGNIRVIFDDQGNPFKAGHRNKTVRKAELKALRTQRKNAARELRESRAVRT